MLVDGRQRVQSKFRRLEGRLVWFGRVNGRDVRPGIYEIRLRAVDRAGNRSVRTSRRPGPRPLRRAPANASRSAPGSASRSACGRTRVVPVALRRRAGRRGRTARCSSFALPRSQARYTLDVTAGPRARATVDVLRAASERPARPPRRQPLRHDAPPRDPRPLARDRDPGRVVLRPTARAAPRKDDRRRAIPRRSGQDPGNPRLGASATAWSPRGSVRECRSERRSRPSTRPTLTPPASRAGATRRRCTCATSRFSTSSSPTRSTST